MNRTRGWICVGTGVLAIGMCARFASVTAAISEYELPDGKLEQFEVERQAETPTAN